MPEKLRKKRILFLLLGLILIYGLWLGIQLVQFQTYTEPSLEKTPLEIQGAYHIHTTHSDGKKSPDKIAELASRSSLDFIILADHGDPNFESMATAGWKKGILVLAGSELSVNRGHLVALGFKSPSTPFSQNAERAAYQIKALDGLSIIAHPYSMVSWSWGESIGYNGLEIINANTMLKYDLLRLVPFLPSLLIKPEFALLKMLKRPEQNLKKWDELNHTHPTFGFFSVDAHILYKPLLPFLQLHALLRNPLSEEFEQASDQVFSALRQGHFYNAVDSAAQASGFRFWAQNGQKRVLMGDKSSLDSSVTLHVQAKFPFAHEVHLIHNGKKIMTSTEKRIVYQPTQPGFYRVEVYLKERTPMRQDIPWILSNPIFFGRKTHDKN
jgi:hypothetical protein